MAGAKTYKSKYKGEGGIYKALVSGSSKKKTTFLPHTVEDKLKIAGKRISKAISGLLD